MLFKHTIMIFVGIVSAYSQLYPAGARLLLVHAGRFSADFQWMNAFNPTLDTEFKEYPLLKNHTLAFDCTKTLITRRYLKGSGSRDACNGRW